MTRCGWMVKNVLDHTWAAPIIVNLQQRITATIDLNLMSFFCDDQLSERWFDKEISLHDVRRNNRDAQ